MSVNAHVCLSSLSQLEAKLPVASAGRDSADRVVSENGQYEELIASSHEIAASTAQLVAASKVGTTKLLCKASPATLMLIFKLCDCR